MSQKFHFKAVIEDAGGGGRMSAFLLTWKKPSGKSGLRSRQR